MTEDNVSSPSWASVIARGIDDRLCDIHVAMPGRVEKVINGKPTRVDVKVMIQQTVELEDGDGELIAVGAPVLPSVPVAILQGGGFFISVPVKVGDFGQIIFNERAIDRFRATGEVTPPGDNRCHSYAGATFWPGGLVPASAEVADAHPDNLVIGRDGGCAIHIKPDDSINLGSAAPVSAVARADLVDAELALIATAVPAYTPTPAGTASGKVNTD